RALQRTDRGRHPFRAHAAQRRSALWADAGHRGLLQRAGRLAAAGRPVAARPPALRHRPARGPLPHRRQSAGLRGQRGTGHLQPQADHSCRHAGRHRRRQRLHWSAGPFIRRFTMKILLAVDGSAYTKKMLAYLTTHLEVFNAQSEFTVFTVQMPLPPRARAAVGAEVANSYYAEESAKVTEPVLKFLGRHGIEAKVVTKVGSPGELIAKTADTGKYDLVIM